MPGCDTSITASDGGKFGGYLLARPAREISFAQVIRVLDGPLALAPCVSPRLAPSWRRFAKLRQPNSSLSSFFLFSTTCLNGKFTMRNFALGVAECRSPEHF